MNMNNWLESKWFYELHSSHVGEEGNMKSLKVRIANFWLKVTHYTVLPNKRKTGIAQQP